MEYKHKIGQLLENQYTVDDSVEDIIKKTQLTPEAIDCLNKLVINTDVSLTPRVCNMNCHDEVYDVNNLETGIPIYGR